eukprot:CAMPEP_0202688440 /NCGR_PEP_ID=MMETSP1385-20130828/3959_1 /ASSEMBLY_ACC=CAM_ASM_000861 /TAXON_ID=933848 /ORGANISM="Elphidium margaritaceum" /LENGTH=1425 /DNA_ID=CAMNT_0049343427 /DNA_START=145 /DNA_END=4422 /DNA_ORIENTATION=-
MSYSLHPQWEGVWEIRGNSRWNGARMVVIFAASQCTLTDSYSLEEYVLQPEPANDLCAHWHFRSHGMAQRYYIGTLQTHRGLNEIEWMELRKHRKTDKWVRINIDPKVYLSQERERKKAVQLRKSSHPSKYRPTASSVKPDAKFVPKYALKRKHKDKDEEEDKGHTNNNNGNNNSNNNEINDPAILNMSLSSHHHQRNGGTSKYQTQHEPTSYNEYYAEYHPKPRRTVLQHTQIHEPRFSKDKAQFAQKLKYVVKGSQDKKSQPPPQQDQQPPAPQTQTQPQADDTRNHGKLSKKEKKQQQKKRGRNRHRFSRHIHKQYADHILEETMHFKSPVILVGEVSISRFNQNICYVRVPGIDRDIRISGFVDRNRAFQEDKVIVSLYPEIEWMAAIKPELTAFQNVLDERDKLAAVEPDEQEEEEEEEDDLNQVILTELTKAVSSPQQQEHLNDSLYSDNTGNDGNEIEDEVIYFSHHEEDDDEEEDEEDEEQPEPEEEDGVSDDIKQTPNASTQQKQKPKPKNKNNKNNKNTGNDIEEKTNALMFKSAGKRNRLHDFVDDASITAFEQYLFLKDCVQDFLQFEEKFPEYALTDAQHPRSRYIAQVIEKCGGKLPAEALQDFSWSDPSRHRMQIPRGRIIGIYEANIANRDTVPGYLQPLVYNEYGEIDRRWAVFTPDDKRYPRAHVPMKELKKPMKDLFNKYEEEEIAIVEEYQNRIYDLERQGRKWKDIKQRTNKYGEQLKLIFFEMSFETKWAQHRFLPVAHVKRKLGKRGSVEVETNVILSKYKISWRDQFKPQIENFVKDFAIDADKDFVGRRDCRGLRVFTIDPTTARDFDDALSIEPLPGQLDANGLKLYRVGIHIADVTHFVREGSVVDKEAKFRATSVYLVDRCLPMLPHHLCQNLCSLNPDVDRLAYSVFVILNEKGHLVHVPPRNADDDDGDDSEDAAYSQSPWFGRTVIRSRARLNYETAHWMLIDKVTPATPVTELDACCTISDDVSLGEIIHDVKLFWKIAKQMRERRFNAGSVQFFRPHIRFRLDPKNEHRALVFGPEIMLWSNNLIEEMMLLANQLVADQLVKNVREHALLRRHPQPKCEKAMKAQLICRSENLELKMDTPQQLNQSMIEMQNKMYGGVPATEIINPLLAQSMSRAQYMIVDDQPQSEWNHWALNFPLYTHFTSPIRRYADVLVHRLLTYTLSMNNSHRNQAVVDVDTTWPQLPAIHVLKQQCDVCNDRNTKAHHAEAASQDIHLCLVLMRDPIVVDAVIVEITNSFFKVVIPGLGLDFQVRFDDCRKHCKNTIVKMRKEWELPDCVLLIEWKSGTIEEFKLFQTIRIRLSSVLQQPIRLTTTIIEPRKRKYLKAANASALQASDEARNGEEEEDVLQENEEEKFDYDGVEEMPGRYHHTPLAMGLEEQLKIGNSDYFAAHYD